MKRGVTKKKRDPVDHLVRKKGKEGGYPRQGSKKADLTVEKMLKGSKLLRGRETHADNDGRRSRTFGREKGENAIGVRRKNSRKGS